MTQREIYHLRTTDTKEFFTGYDISQSDVNLYHSPTIAARLSKQKAEVLKQTLPERYDSLWGRHFEIVSKPMQVIPGTIFMYHIFEDELLVCRRIHLRAERKWEHIYGDDGPQTYDKKWEALTDRDQNEGVYMVDPESIGALTEAPILAFNVEIEDTLVGRQIAEEQPAGARMFWYPDYQVKDELEILDKKGYLYMDAEIELNHQTDE